MLSLWLESANPFWPNVSSFQESTEEKRMQCASVRKKGGTDQCRATAMRGHTLCGTHARAKVPVLWADAHRSRGGQIARVQAVVRGWLVRKRVALGGPGVLRRKDLANDEELVTCEDKTRQHPFEYFAFEEAGKVWWFDFQSLWKWSSQSHAPTNPYTKVPLSQETRRRLRAMWAYRQRHRLPLAEESTVYEQRLSSRWNVVCQVFADNGFVDVHPMNFADLGQSELATMFVLLERDIQVLFSENDPGRARALRLCRRAIRADQPLYVLWAVYTMMLLLTVHKDPYTMTFSILSALYRC